MLGDSIDINNFCCNPVVLKKKLVKPLKIAFSGPNCTTKWSAWAVPKMKNNFLLAEITKADHQLSETFYFIKISFVLGDFWIFFYFVWCFFYQKGPFPAKIAVSRNQVFSYKRDEMLEFWWWSWRNYRTLNVNKFMLLSQTWKGLLIRDIRDWLSISW